ncbi:MAG TPA: hypothetical protein VD995_07600 [Azospirillum sp.]|nr:hypothetical protein [Azospirillum sp.]
MKVKVVLIGAGTLAGALMGAGCSSPDRAVFVTSTNIGVNADATSRVVNLGYDRTEGFVGPDYVDTGAAPPAVGYIESNLEVFAPKIKQVYATGKAADIVTRADASEVVVAPDDYAGERRIMAFGTSSNVGLKLGFATSTGVPDSISFGYKRSEASIIPFRSGDPTTGQPDQYASVLASVDMDQATTTLSESKLRMTQFVATGVAAQNLAKSGAIQGIFRNKANAALSLGEQDAQQTRTGSTSFADCVSSNGQLNVVRLNSILDQALSANVIAPTNVGLLRQAPTTAELKSRLGGALQSEAVSLGTYVKSNPTLCNS